MEKINIKKEIKKARETGSAFMKPHRKHPDLIAEKKEKSKAKKK